MKTYKVFWWLFIVLWIVAFIIFSKSSTIMDVFLGVGLLAGLIMLIRDIFIDRQAIVAKFMICLGVTAILLILEVLSKHTVLVAYAIITSMSYLERAFEEDKVSDNRGDSRSSGYGSSRTTFPIGKNETDGYSYYAGPQRGVDYPSSWHDSNTPGGSLDI